LEIWKILRIFATGLVSKAPRHCGKIWEAVCDLLSIEIWTISRNEQTRWA